MITKNLSFFPANELPVAEMANQEVLTYSPDDGWHIGYVLVIEDDEQIFDICIFNREGIRLVPNQHFTFWALLNTSICPPRE